MFPQARNPPRKAGTGATAVVRQAPWSHPAPLRLHYGSLRLHYGSLRPITPLYWLRACKPRNLADTRNGQSHRRRNCNARRLRRTGGRVPHEGWDVTGPRLQARLQERDWSVTDAAVLTDPRRHLPYPALPRSTDLCGLSLVDHRQAPLVEKHLPGLRQAFR